MSNVAPHEFAAQDELRDVLDAFMAEFHERWSLLGSITLRENTGHASQPVAVAIVYDDANGSAIPIATVTGPGPALRRLIGGEIVLADALENGATIQATIGGWSFTAYLFGGPWRA